MHGRGGGRGGKKESQMQDAGPQLSRSIFLRKRWRRHTGLSLDFSYLFDNIIVNYLCEV